MIKVLVVDDSAFMRQIFKKTINKDPDLEVMATARHGEQALQLISRSRPDVITLDIEMPQKNGMETLKQIMSLPQPIPVIMVSAVDNRETVLKSLEEGAFDFIPKPSGSISLNIDEITDQLIQKLKSAVNCKNPPDNIKTLKTYSQKIKGNIKEFPVIAIGSSSGGPRALKEVLSVFPADLPAAIVIVQHMPAGFTASLARRLHQSSAISVKEANSGDQVSPGLALLAPGDYHMQISPSKKIILNQKPKKWGIRPCVDYMMISAAEVYQNRMIGVILTGMGHDGARGMVKIKENNGYGIVEDKSTALVYGMPASTIEKNAYDKIISLDQIPFHIIKLLERGL